MVGEGHRTHLLTVSRMRYERMSILSLGLGLPREVESFGRSSVSFLELVFREKVKSR